VRIRKRYTTQSHSIPGTSAVLSGPRFPRRARRPANGTKAAFVLPILQVSPESKTVVSTPRALWDPDSGTRELDRHGGGSARDYWESSQACAPPVVIGGLGIGPRSIALRTVVIY